VADPELAREAAQQTAEAWEGGFPLSEDQYKKLIDDLKPVNNKVVSDYLRQLHERRGKDNRFLTPMDFYHVLNMVDANSNPAKKKQPSQQKQSKTPPQSPDTLSVIGADVMGVLDKAQDIVGTAIDYAAMKAGIAKFGADINQYHDDYLDQLKASGKPDAEKPTAGTPSSKGLATSSTSAQSPGSHADSPSSGQPNSAPRSTVQTTFKQELPNPHAQTVAGQPGNGPSDTGRPQGTMAEKFVSSRSPMSFAALEQTTADLVHVAQLGDISEIIGLSAKVVRDPNHPQNLTAVSRPVAEPSTTIPAAPAVPPGLKPPKL